MHKKQPRYSIRQELEEFSKEQLSAQHRAQKATQHQSKAKNYHGLKMAWKDVVIFSLLMVFTSVYQVRAQQTTPLPTIDFDDISSGMLLSFDPSNGDYSALQMTHANYDVDIFGILATVTVQQQFTNPTDQWISEGIYAFPIADTSAVYAMRLKVGNRVIEGEIHETKAAEMIYQEAKQAGQTTSMVKQYRPNLFTTDIANIAPNESISIEITYQQTIQYDSGRFDFRIPLAIKPRYVNPSESGNILLPQNTVTDVASRHINIDLDAGFELAELQSLNHNVEIDSTVDGQQISLTDNQLYDARDFVLRWQPLASDQPVAAYFSEYKDNHEYALLMMMPPATTEKMQSNRNVTFIIDTSGSMHGPALNQAKDALLFALSELEPRNHFNIIDFDSETKPLFNQSQIATPDNINRAIEFIDQLSSDGGTNMEPALLMAMQESNTIDTDLNQIIFITDGSVGNEAHIFRQISEQIGSSRLFTVAIGEAPNNYFMNKAAMFGKGTYTHIADLNQVDEAMSILFNKIASPSLTDIGIAWKGHYAQNPSTIPDLYHGEPVIVTARLDSRQNSFQMSGYVDHNQPWNNQVAMRPDGQSYGIARMWARNQVEELTDDLMLGGDHESLKAQIVELALKHHLVTEFTALVAVDKTPNTSRMTDARAAQELAFPQGSLGWQAQLLLGLFILFFVWALNFKSLLNNRVNQKS